MITILGIGIIVCLFIYYWPKLQQIIEDQLTKSLSREADEKGNQPLYKLFYKFNHDSSDAWIAWVQNEDRSTQDRAFAILIEHLESHPKEWGVITTEIIKAVVALNYPESFDALLDFLRTARKYWGRYKSMSFCYEAACKGIVEIKPSRAKEVLLNELDSCLSQKEIDDLKIIIVRAIASFPEEHSVADLLTRVITNRLHNIKVRREAFKAAGSREEEKYKIFSNVIRKYAEEEYTSLSDEDTIVFKRIYEELFDKLEEDDTWQLIILACNGKFSKTAAIAVMSAMVERKDMNFDTEQLNTVFNIHDISDRLKESLSKRFELSNDEIKVAYEHIPLANYSFHRDNIVSETLKEEILIPEHMQELFSSVDEALAKKQVLDENGQERIGGGVVFVGSAEEEKLYISRAIAAKRKWSFIYTNLTKVIHDARQINEVAKTVRSSKPCLLYVENLKLALDHSEDGNNILMTLNQLYLDPMVFVIGTIKDPLSIKADQELPEILQEVPRDTFPIFRECNACKDKDKALICESYISKLSDNREQDKFELSNLASLTGGFSTIEFISYFLRYMQTSLLVFGKLVPINDYKNLKHR